MDFIFTGLSWLFLFLSFYYIENNDRLVVDVFDMELDYQEIIRQLTNLSSKKEIKAVIDDYCKRDKDGTDFLGRLSSNVFIETSGISTVYDKKLLTFIEKYCDWKIKKIKIINMLKTNSWGNLKWLISIVLSLIALIVSIIAFIHKS